MNLFLFLPIFLLSIILVFVIPGRVILGKLFKESLIITLIASTLLGIALWGWQGYIFGYMHLRPLSYAYVLFFLMLFIKNRKYLLSFPKIKISRFDCILFFLVIIGVIGQNLPYIMAGIITNQGMRLMTYNRPDHIWHISLTNEIIRHFPPFEPGMYGVPLSNYHYWFNLVTAELIRVVQLPLFATQFDGMYILGSLLLAGTILLLSQVIDKSKKFFALLLFFFFFSGDAIYWLIFIVRHKLNFSLLPIVDATIFMDNPPRAFSTIVALFGIYLLFKYLRNLDIKKIVLISLVLGSVIGFKVYTGIAILAGLAILAVYEAFKRRWEFTLLFILTLFFSLMIFLPVNYASGGLFLLPFDLPRDFLTQKAIGLTNMILEWQVYQLHHNILRITEYGLIMSLLFIFAQFGVKLVGVIQTKKTLNILGTEKFIFLLTTTLVPLILGLFFYEKSGGANVFNFFITSTLFLSVFASLTIASIREKKMFILVVLIVVLLSIPRWFVRTVATIRRDYNGSFSGISNSELSSYGYFLSTPKESIILVDNRTSFDSLSPSVSVLSRRNTFLSGQAIIGSHNNTDTRRIRIANQIFNSKNSKIVNDLLHKNNINYIYFWGEPDFKANISKLTIVRVFHNKTVSIFEVR